MAQGGQVLAFAAPAACAPALRGVLYDTDSNTNKDDPRSQNKR